MPSHPRIFEIASPTAKSYSSWISEDITFIHQKHTLNIISREVAQWLVLRTQDYYNREAGSSSPAVIH